MRVDEARQHQVIARVDDFHLRTRMIPDPVARRDARDLVARDGDVGTRRILPIGARGEGAPPFDQEGRPGGKARAQT